MSIVVKESGGTRSEPVEAGTYQARCVGVVDIGVQYNEKFEKRQEKVILIFELPTERITVEGEDKPRWISKRYTANLNDKSNLYRDLCSWRGRPFTEDELHGFSLANVLNAPCVLTIVNTERGGNKYADINAVSKIMKGMEVPPLENEALLFDMEADDAESVFAKLPKWIQELIEKSDTWKHRGQGDATELDDDDGEHPF